MVCGMRFAASFCQSDEIIVFVEGRGEIRPANDDLEPLCLPLMFFRAHAETQLHVRSRSGWRKESHSVMNLEMVHKGEDTLTIWVGGERVLAAEGGMTIPELN